MHGPGPGGEGIEEIVDQLPADPDVQREYMLMRVLLSAARPQEAVSGHREAADLYRQAGTELTRFFELIQATPADPGPACPQFHEWVAALQTTSDAL